MPGSVLVMVGKAYFFVHLTWITFLFLKRYFHQVLWIMPYKDFSSHSKPCIYKKDLFQQPSSIFMLKGREKSPSWPGSHQTRSAKILMRGFKPHNIKLRNITNSNGCLSPWASTALPFKKFKLKAWLYFSPYLNLESCTAPKLFPQDWWQRMKNQVPGPD